MTDNTTGDRIVTADDDLAVQTIDAPSNNTAGQGDKHEANLVVLAENPTIDAPTAGALRAAGYDGIPEDTEDDEVLAKYQSDRIVTADDDLAVQEVTVGSLVPSQPSAELVEQPANPELEHDENGNTIPPTTETSEGSSDGESLTTPTETTSSDPAGSGEQPNEVLNPITPDGGAPLTDGGQDGAETTDGDGTNPEDTETVQPNKSANKAEWVAFAVASGATEEEAEGLTIAELQETYGTFEES